MKAVMLYIKRHRCSSPALNLSLLCSNQEQQEWGTTTIFLNEMRKVNMNVAPNPCKPLRHILGS